MAIPVMWFQHSYVPLITTVGKLLKMTRNNLAQHFRIGEGVNPAAKFRLFVAVFCSYE